MRCDAPSKRTQRRVLFTAADSSDPAAVRRERNRDWMRKDRAKNPQKYRQRERARRTQPDVAARRKRVVRQWMLRRFFTSKARDISDGLDVVTGSQLAALYHRQRGRCALSGRRLTRENMQIDHVVPLAGGGWRGLENVRWVCKEANTAKWTLSDAEFIALCRDVVGFTANGEPWL